MRLPKERTSMAEPHPVLPDVLAQIRQVPVSNRPLIICDVDEVILHMISHLEAYLQQRGITFLRHEYRLTGNIAKLGADTPLPPERVRTLLMDFFDEENHRQTMVDGADAALNQLSEVWDVVLLTNLPGHHNKTTRTALLREMNIVFPLVTNSGPKGGAVAALSAGRKEPVVFIDDSPSNHASVNASLPASVQIQFIADPRFLQSMTAEDHVDLLTGDWQETATFIQAIL